MRVPDDVYTINWLWEYLMTFIPYTDYESTCWRYTILTMRVPDIYTILTMSTCWRLYHKLTLRVPADVYAIYWLWEYLQTFIPYTYYESTCWHLYHKLTMRVPDDVYTINWLWEYLQTFIPYTDYESTCWRLYHKLTMRVPADVYTIYWLWEYLLTFIP